MHMLINVQVPPFACTLLCVASPFLRQKHWKYQRKRTLLELHVLKLILIQNVTIFMKLAANFYTLE